MRRTTAEAIKKEQILLKQLKNDWIRLNRPTISKELRDSLYTRIEELGASIKAKEIQLRRQESRDARTTKTD
jgi:hypothetical protein